MYAIEMLNITKKFNNFKANDNINLRVKNNEIHAILGENGAGKTTLMNILFGIYRPDNGIVKINGQIQNMKNPNIANKLGIGMVHQHFRLIDNFTVTENIILGNEPKKGITIDIKKAKIKVEELSRKYKLNVFADDYIRDLSIGQQQKVEILKMLYRNANILIFDEPTAVLSLDEIEELIEIIKKLKNEGKTIVIITHKLREIELLADMCTILRKGQSVNTLDVSKISKEELASQMLGSTINFNLSEKIVEKIKSNVKVLSLKNITLESKNKKILNNINFDVFEGEILGISGVEGNGQNELVDIIVGKLIPNYGEIELLGENIVNLNILNRIEKGISFIPEDRHKQGLILDFCISENIILKEIDSQNISKNNILNKTQIKKFANKIVEDYNIKTPDGIKSITRNLSGGNQQKIIIGREIEKKHKLLIAFQPTRGLDVIAIDFIHRKLNEERRKKTAILLISYEIDEILKLSNRILVLHNGEIMDILNYEEATKDKIGLLMAGVKEKTRKEI